MRVQRRVWTLGLLLGLGVAQAVSCTKTEEEQSPPSDATVEAGTAPTPALDLWAGVPPLEPELTDAVGELAPRPEPLRPPTVHETIEIAFPGPLAETEVPVPVTSTDPLKVERHGPTGEQNLVDAVRMSFDQPMVPLADVTALKAKPIPFTIEPAVPGDVKWLGTRTLAFMPEAGRMPMSTEYKVTVPASTTSTWGQSLGRDFEWTFSTPTLALESSSPWNGDGEIELEPTINLVFNQTVASTTLAAALELRGGGDRMGLGLVTPPSASPPSTEPEWKRSRRVAVKPERKLRPNTRYTLTLPAGVYGEGPRRSSPISVSFSTYPPLVLRRSTCWGTCWADDGISIESSTALDDPSVITKVHVSPEPEGLSVTAGWNQIHLAGKFEGRKRYKVTIDAGVRDVHGQTTTRPFVANVTLGPPRPNVSLSTNARRPAVIEKAASKEIRLNVAGVKQLEIEARALELAELPAFWDAYPYDTGHEWPRDHAASTYRDRIVTPAAMRRSEQMPLDLGPMLTGPGQHLWFLVRSNPVTSDGWTERYGIHMLVEVTDLGIAAAMDRDSGLVMVTRLSNGEPVSGATVKVIDQTGDHTKWSGTTDAEGLVRIDSLVASGGMILTAQTSDDSAAMMLDRNELRGRWAPWGSATPSDEPRAFFYTDRTPYKPGETVHLMGILRNETRGPKGRVELWRTDFEADYVVTSPRGIEVAKGTVKVGRFGTFDVDIPTKEEHGTGSFSFVLTVPSLLSANRTFYHSFPVETFRTPEFTVAVERTESGPLIFGDHLEAEIRGRYLHGAPLVGGEVQYTLQRARTDFQPPGSLNDGFTFGTGSSYYGRPYDFGYYGGYGGYGYGGYGRGGYGRGGWGPMYGSTVVKSGTGELDARGNFTVEHDLLAVEPPPEGTKAPPPPATPKTEDEGPPPAATFTLDATVIDQNRQAIAGKGSFVVHAARVYVGLRSDKTVLREGERAHLEAVLVDLEGERVTGSSVDLALVRRETTRTAVERDGQWVYESKTEEHEAGTCALSSALVPAACDLDVAKAGTYLVRGTAKDADGHVTRSELTLFVYGKDAVVWENTERRVDLVPDRREYAPGDTATVLVRSPFDTARGVVVVEREGIAREIPITVEGGAATVEIPIEEAMLPSVSVSALLTRGRVEIPGAPAGQDLGMPAAATGNVQLAVSTADKTIEIELTPSATELAPGEELTLQLHTKTAKGEALPSAVAVMVVDEGVLSLMGFETPDPLSFFHHGRSDDVWMYALQNSVLAREVPPPVGGEAPPPPPAEPMDMEESFGLGNVGTLGHGAGGDTGAGFGRGGGGMADPAPSAAAPAAPGGGMAKEKKSSGARTRSAEREGAVALDPSAAMAQPVSLREVFATTAFFDAEILTDSSGNATVKIPMPENLTTFRIMAVAVDPAMADRFGHGDTSVRLRKPIMVRPSLPRFANFGDRFEASVMVDNQTETDQAVLVGTRGINVSLPSSTQKMIDIPAGESREVRFDMEVLAVGTMRLQFAAMSNGGRDATEISLPVHYPATAEAFADYGMIDTATQRTIEPPADALPAFGGLELSMSSTALSGLEDAVDYLVTYPYECAEQTASRVLPIFALSDILDDFPVSSLRDDFRRKQIARAGIERLLSKQNYDGGFGYWQIGESWPYLTNWVTLALLEGKRAGYDVDAKALDRALAYVENFVTYGQRTRWGVYHDWTSRALGLWLLSGEKRGAALFDRVWAHREEMPLYARALLMGAAHRYGRTAARDTVIDELRDAVVESPKAIHFAESRSEANAEGLAVLMHSSVQTDAVALIALLEAVPTDPMLPKVMAGIMASRDPKQGGRWGTTHANAWALLAADRYYETVEADEPDFTARVWLDETLSAQQQFKGRSMTSVEARLPMAKLQGAAQRSLVVGKDGPGKLYYRMGLRYAPQDLKLPAQDQGFQVFREYTALPDGNGGEADATAVQRLDDGTWVVKAGTNVKVSLTVIVRDRSYYVVVDDALPAGFEGQNPRFRTSVAASSSGSVSPGYSHWWYPWWSFDHTDMRDDRMLLFADQLPAGVYTYSYTARATSIGTFHLPPIKAEAMYEPERFGHSDSSMVRVVE